MNVFACVAPALAPGMVRLVALASGAAEPTTLAELTPDQARSLASALQMAALAAKIATAEYPLAPD